MTATKKVYVKRLNEELLEEEAAFGCKPTFLWWRHHKWETHHFGPASNGLFDYTRLGWRECLRCGRIEAHKSNNADEGYRKWWEFTGYNWIPEEEAR